MGRTNTYTFLFNYSYPSTARLLQLAKRLQRYVDQKQMSCYHTICKRVSFLERRKHYVQVGIVIYNTDGGFLIHDSACRPRFKLHRRCQMTQSRHPRSGNQTWVAESKFCVTNHLATDAYHQSICNFNIVVCFIHAINSVSEKKPLPLPQRLFPDIRTYCTNDLIYFPNFRFYKLKVAALSDSVTSLTFPLPRDSSRKLMTSVQRLLHNHPDDARSWVLLAAALNADAALSDSSNGSQSKVIQITELALKKGKKYFF